MKCVNCLARTAAWPGMLAAVGADTHPHGLPAPPLASFLREGPGSEQLSWMFVGSDRSVLVVEKKQ